MSEPIFNFHDTMLLATAFQSFLFVMLIMIAKHDHHVSDYYLVGFFLMQIAIPIHILVNYGEQFRFIALDFSPALFRMFDFAFWLEGPLLLWYTRSLLYKNFKITRFDLLYLLPTVSYILYVIFTFYSVDTASKVSLITAREDIRAPSLQHAIEAVKESLRVFFGVLCLIDIQRAQQQIRERYSNIEKIEFSWLSFLVVAFTIARAWVLIVIVVSFLAPNLNHSVFNSMGLMGNYLTFALISALMFFSLQRSTLFDGHLGDDANSSDASDYKIDPELTAKIEEHMRKEKPYLQHLLNLEQLATQLSMHPRALSVAIKHNFSTNFYEFVNSYRIEEAKRVLADPAEKTKTMIEILGECGFNSKATYNTFFKKLVGSTPTQYRVRMLRNKT